MTTLILAEPQPITRGIWTRDFERAGFTSVTAHEFVPGVLTRVTGYKPA